MWRDNFRYIYLKKSKGCGLLNKNFDNCHYGSIWIGKNHFMFPRGCWEVVVDIITIPGYLYYLDYYLDCEVFRKLNKLLQLVLVSFLSFFETLGRRVRYDMINLFIFVISSVN